MSSKEVEASPGVLSNLVKRVDGWIAGWVNPATGQGTATDRTRQAYWGGGVALHPLTLSSLFTYNDLARAIVSALPEWGLRHGWDLVVQNEDPLAAQAIATSVRMRMDELGAHNAELKAATWGQLFGGGLVLIGAIDGRATHEPLDIDNLEDIDWLRVVPRQYAWPVEVDQSPESPTYGKPLMYDVRELALGLGGVETQRYHHTRVLRYPGPLTTDEERVLRNGWDQSLLDHVLAKLNMSDSLWDDVASMVHDGSLGVWKIKGLFHAVLSGRRDQIEARFSIADKTKSVFRSLLLDADGEDFSFVHRQFSGVADLLAQSAIRTAAAAQMPVTVLFGQSPAGLNATGESDIRLWYDRVEQYSTDVLHPGTEYLVRLILRCKNGPTQGAEPDSWSVKYRSVRKATPMEQAEIEARQAQTDSTYMASGVLTPAEVAVSRFRPEGWSHMTQPDVRRHIKAMKQAAADLETEATSNDVQQQALNGAQQQALTAIIAQVARGEIPRDSGIEALILSYPGLVDRERAERLMANAGAGFTPTGSQSAAQPTTPSTEQA